MAGYPLEILMERENQCEKYTCAYCKLLLNDPHQSRCGHRYCKPCISDLLRETESFTCQLCDPETEPDVDNIITATKIFRDNAIKKEMKLLNTKCINDGCKWSGKFEGYGDHRQSCNYGVIACPSGCGNKIRRLNIDVHRNNECLSRYVNCEYCGMRLQAKDIKNHHHYQCPEIKVECEFCGQKVIRRQIQSHVDISSGNCHRKMKPCRFRDIGCNRMVELDKEDIHNAAFMKEHLDMLFQQIAELLNFRSQVKENAGEVRRHGDDVQKHQEVMLTLRQSLKHMEDYLREQPHFATSKVPNSSLKDFTIVLEKLTKSNRDLEMKSNITGDSVATYANIVKMLSQEVEKYSDMTQAMGVEDKNFRERLDAVEKKTKAQDRIIQLKDITLAEQDLRIQSLEMASYDGILTWKITDFGRKRRDAISGRTLSLYSPYFFTSRFGYKMCARIDLNGDGMGKGNHVSLFFVVMKGEYDAILKWPFGQKVTFMWIDQNNREHMIDAFRPDPNSSSFKRPTRDMNIASGCPFFMPLSMLESIQHAYVKDNTAFLRVIVDTHDL